MSTALSDDRIFIKNNLISLFIMRTSLQPAFILHYRPYRETSLIVDLFTRDYGRIAVVARGVRGPRSRNRALFQPFLPILVSWQGRSELMTLCSIESMGSPLQLKGSCLLSAFYLNELLMRVLQKQDPHPKLYNLYHETLLALQSTESSLKKGFQKPLRIFEKKLLEELGYGLQLQYDIPNGKPLMAEQSYCFYPEQGFKLHNREENIPQSLIFFGKSLLALASEKLDNNEFLYDAKRLMRLAFAPILGPQPLFSRQLFVEVEVE